MLSFIFNSNSKRLIYSLLVFSVSALIIDQAIYFSLKYLHSQNYYGQTGGKVNYVLNGIPNVNTLVMGSSKAYHNVNTGKIKNSFNIGHDGSRIAMNLAIVELMEINGKLPRNILLHTDPGLYFKSDSQNFYNGNDINIISTFYNESQLIKKIITENNSKWLAYKLFKSFAFNGKVLSLTKNYIKTKKYSKDRSDGFGPLIYNQVEQEKFIKSIQPQPIVIDSNKCYDDIFSISLLTRFILICKKNDINLICFNAPEYLGNIYCNENLMNLFIEHDIEFYDYSDILTDHAIFKETKYWKDNAHLNKEGADIFTDILVRDTNMEGI
jgi:hypothetical protein